MKKILKYTLITSIGITLIALTVFEGYRLWPQYFPKYSIGECIEDESSGSVFKIKGIAGQLKGSKGIPSIIMKPGIHKFYEVGSTARIDVDKSSIRRIPCPN